MFPATPTNSTQKPANVPLKLPVSSTEDPARSFIFFLWGYFKYYWASSTQPSLATTTRTEMRCTPRSYLLEMDELYERHSDRRVFEAYLTKALDTVPLEVLQTSVYFWGHENFSFICKLLENRPEQFRQLIKLTPIELYNYYPMQCTTESQIEILLDDAFKNEKKLQEITDVIVAMIGDLRNGFELDNLCYFYLNQLIERQQSDAYIARRIEICKKELAMVQVEALKKIQNAPHITKALQDLLNEKMIDENL